MSQAVASPTADDDAAAGNVQSVDRALTILELLAADGVLGVTEIAGLLGVHKSTVSRLLSTLAAHGLAEQLPDRGRYRLGVGVLRLAGATRSQLDVVRQTRPIAVELAARTGETVNLVILSGTETLYLDQVAGTSALQIHNWVGARNPLHATSNGRVLLAHASAAEQQAILAAIGDPQGRLPALTENTVKDRDALQRILAGVRAQGYAVVIDKLEVGLTAAAAPIRGTDGTVIASLSVSGPSFRFMGQRVDDAMVALREAADEASAQMGYSDRRR